MQIRIFRSPLRTHVLFPVMSVLALTTVGAGCRSGPAAQPAAVSADTWAVVDGRTISRQDVEKAFRRTQDNAQALSPEEATTVKLSLLNELIVQDIVLAKARDLKIEVPAAELDTAYNDAKKNMTEEAFQAELKKRALSPDDMREGLRRELLVKKLMEREVTSKVNVTDQDITTFYNTNKAQFTVAEEAYRIAQIVVTPQRGQQQANRTGNDATSAEEAAFKVRMIMERLKSGAPFAEVAMDYSEDPQSAPRGGDLGLVPVSALQKAPAPLRDAVLNQAPGTVRVATSGGVHTIVAVVAHEMPGERGLSTPGVREGITQTIKSRREQLLRTAYLSAARNDAEVNNYFARRLVESQGKM
jgi:peptidyl-prolyl cis-trans isomerase SurA